MIATLTIDEAGQIQLPEALRRAFGVEPGASLQAHVTLDRIEIVRQVPEVTEGVMEEGLLLLPRTRIKIDIGEAIRADRERQSERAIPR